jgi:hypothetical protein
MVDVNATLTEELKAKLIYVTTLKERATTQGEAEAAAAALTRLMTRYGLAQMHLDMLVQDKKAGSSFTHDMVDLGAAAQWRRNLFFAICKYNFSTMVQERNSTKVHFIGEKRNLELIQSMYAWLVLEVNAVADQAWKDRTPRRGDTIKAWKNAFRRGMVAGLYDAMKAARDAEVAAYSGGSALMVVNEDALKAAVLEFIGKTTKSSAQRLDADAYNAGYKAGEGTNFDTKRIS